MRASISRSPHRPRQRDTAAVAHSDGDLVASGDLEREVDGKPHGHFGMLPAGQGDVAEVDREVQDGTSTAARAAVQSLQAPY
jgi:hypothetical protein